MITQLTRVVAACAVALAGTAAAADVRGTLETRPALLVPDFVEAIEHYADAGRTRVSKPEVQLWLDGFAARGVDPAFVQRRLFKARQRSADPYAAFREVRVELFDAAAGERASTWEPVGLHAFRLDVVEDYDDVTNDDVYGYFITTHDDLVWGKVTSIYTGLDEGDSFFFSAEDRGLFGPKGEKLAPRNHTIVDFGLVESDGDDIKDLHKLSDAIVDLALVALSIGSPQAGAAAAQARAEVQNLLRLVISMDSDDRLVTDTLRFTPSSMASMLAGTTVTEFSRFYERETFWTHYAWRIHFRLLR